MTIELPTWISTRDDRLSPFGAQMRKHLAGLAERDPRVPELVARLEAKGAAGSKEWEWARRICHHSDQVMAELHKEYGPADEHDILMLAGFAADHSYAHFFTQYAFAQRLIADSRKALEDPATKPEAVAGLEATIATQEKLLPSYKEVILRITPIVTDLQPNVAVGYAPQIHEVFSEAGRQAEVEKLFFTIARNHPQAIMGNYGRIEQFGNVNTLMYTAQTNVYNAARRSPEGAEFAERLKIRRAADAAAKSFRE